ncbi:MAG: hypothetical protein Edafosvirus10_1 [Edafosvirus sp.]|uniref:C2H2-type domain-containing protein n=1 Tax=Edafosvirus sp. TaxID=2487765 RepID=A0A3G4ZTU4_9VIRU|nr:MAG: hypothetical protein Edafosvirus10_1 [Edafosvirus sp.]
MKHECIICEYITTRKDEFNRHNESKKHLIRSGVIQKTKEEIEELKEKYDFVCENCGEPYKHNSSLKRHKEKNICKPIVQNEPIIDQQDLLKIIEQKDELIKNLYEDKVDLLERQLEYFMESNKAYQQTFDFIVNNIMPYEIGLEQPIDYSVLHDEENDNKLLDELIYQYEKNSLADYFVGLLVKFYKKDDPRQQAVQNTDAPRVNYVIILYDEVFDENSKKKRTGKWQRDKGGLLFGKAGLDNLFVNLNDYLKVKIHDRCKLIEKLIAKGKDADREMEKNMVVCKIQKKIQDESFKHEIIKKACPHFAFSKEKYEQQILKLEQ